jgi:hypothetical protein
MQDEEERGSGGRDAESENNKIYQWNEKSSDRNPDKAEPLSKRKWRLYPPDSVREAEILNC